ncbi:hemerythrin-like metal-binding domain-containing protein [Helicobacter aurati]|uniref:Hemerythrin-like metal-binding domain-containing protein n=2 Tax=Helicobacter aurati TaxID=137778 RepID=A0A3D8J562_9HELI|nr:hemerythrin-like metal-binding domain-containing protein [Helicobacter aurati]
MSKGVIMLAWDDKYSVGNYLIDEQHKKLFELANMADNMIGKQTDPAEIKKMLAALFEYMKTHFRDEETYMAGIQYPGLNLHKEKHKQIIAEITLLVKNMKHDFKQQLVIIMEQWLLKHILQEDMGYHNYREDMKAKRAKQASTTNVPTTENKSTSILKSSTLETKAKGKKGVMHIYTCLCGNTYNIAPDIHAKIQSGEETHKCQDCTTNIKYVTDHEVN